MLKKKQRFDYYNYKELKKIDNLLININKERIIKRLDTLIEFRNYIDKWGTLQEGELNEEMAIHSIISEINSLILIYNKLKGEIK